MENILKEHHLRVTPIRTEVLEFFKAGRRALSHADLEERFAAQFDRVTLYRTLNTFLESGLLHKIPDDSGTAKFALCQESCDTHAHLDDHVHFKCSACGTIECLHDSHIPVVEIPSNYSVASASLLLEGTCPACNNK